MIIMPRAAEVLTWQRLCNLFFILKVNFRFMLLARLSPHTLLLKLNLLQSPVASRIFISVYMYQIVNVIFNEFN